MRPDGYGFVRRGRRDYGFFLEFDRGTVHPAALRAKFAAYQRYMSSARVVRDYAGFPTVLVVTTGPGDEQRIVDAVVAVNTAWTRYLNHYLRANQSVTAWLVPNEMAALRRESRRRGLALVVHHDH